MSTENHRLDDKIIVYRSYSNLSEAYETKNILEMNGIPCFISNENMATVYPLYNSHVGGIRLHIFEKDIAAADNLLANP